MFAGNEMLDRARTETHLFSEFVSKMAGSHSVKDLKTMCEECGQHQIDFVRRDSERLFKHGERMLETASKLFVTAAELICLRSVMDLQSLIAGQKWKKMDSVQSMSTLPKAEAPRLPCPAHAPGYGGDRGRVAPGRSRRPRLTKRAAAGNVSRATARFTRWRRA